MSKKYSKSEEKSRAKAWMHASAQRTIAHSSSSSSKRLCRNNSDTTSVLNYVKDVSQFKPSRAVKPLFVERKSNPSASATSSFSDDKGKGKTKAKFAGYEDFDDDFEFQQPSAVVHGGTATIPIESVQSLQNPQKAETSMLDDNDNDGQNHLQVDLLEIPSGENLRDSVVLTLIKACTPDIVSIADGASANSLAAQSADIIQKPHVGSSGKADTVSAHGLVHYADYRDTVQHMNSSAPTNVLISSETGASMPIQFRDITAYYPAERDIVENMGDDTVYVEHKAELLLERASVYVIDDDMPVQNLSDTAQMAVPDNFWDSLFDNDNSVLESETMNAGDREFVRDRDGTLIDVSKIKKKAYASRNEDGSMRKTLNWTCAREFKNQKTQLPDRYVEIDDDEPSDDVIADTTVIRQMYVEKPSRVWCAWLNMMSIVDAISRNDYTDDMARNFVRILSFLNMLGVFVDADSDLLATVTRTLGATMNATTIASISEQIIGAHSTRYERSEKAQAIDYPCAACLHCRENGTILIYLIKAMLVMESRFLRLIEMVSTIESIDTAMVRVERQSAIDEQCPWSTMLRAFEARDRSAMLCLHNRVFELELAKSMSKTDELALFDEHSNKVRCIVGAGHAHRIISMYNKAHKNCSRESDTDPCDVCDSSPRTLLLASTCLMWTLSQLQVDGNDKY